MSNNMVILPEQCCIQQNITLFYRFDKHIGSGKFAEVYFTYQIQTMKLRKVKAIKIKKIKESNRNEASLINEIDSLCSLHHLNICSMHGLMRTQSTSTSPLILPGLRQVLRFFTKKRFQNTTLSFTKSVCRCSSTSTKSPKGPSRRKARKYFAAEPR